MLIKYVRVFFLIWLSVGSAWAESGLSTRPVKWIDPDNRNIAQPQAVEQNVIWDIVDHTFFYEVGKVFNLEWTTRRLGNLAQVVPLREADNVNVLDEAPNSSWYTNRHFLQRMSEAELQRGPGEALPDTTRPWTVIRGKFDGVAPGLRIRDAKGDVYFLKFDAKGNPELASTAEVVSTKILYAAGYFVPQNSVVYFDPSRLQMGDHIPHPDGRGGTRDMTDDDLREILDFVTKEPDGRIRCLSSRRLEGVPLGVFAFHDVKKDDPNDRVYHEHRRELRGLRVVSSWINDTDRRAANTLNMYMADEEGRHYVKHYLIDMGATLGSSTVKPRTPKSGNEYFVDVRHIVPSALGLGLYHKPWEEVLPMPYVELGYLESEVFDPQRWVTNYPNAAFQRCTPRDGYWGAKIVMSFTDADLEAIVATAHLSNPGAAKELVRLLKERRDKIGRFWFGKVNPLDRFWIDPVGLHFDDLAVLGNLASASETTYRYRVISEKGKEIQAVKKTVEPLVRLPGDLQAGDFYGVEIYTQRPGGDDRAVRVYFYKWAEGRYQIVKVVRGG